MREGPVMSDYFSKIDPGELVPLLFLVSMFLWLMVHSVSKVWLKYRKAELTANLKHEMLARGMSAQEIKTVLDAGENNPTNSRCSA
jgi:hypothetical protein